MEITTQQHLENLKGTDKELRYASFLHIITETERPVDWVYAVWDDLLVLLKKEDNRQRAIAAQVLSNLAKSDFQQRLLSDFGKLLQVTKDEKFVTARHALQILWKVGIASEPLRDRVVTELRSRFGEAASEKNGTLVRYDIVVVFQKMFEHFQDETLKQTTLALVETEENEKYRKKYLGVWKDVLKGK